MKILECINTLELVFAQKNTRCFLLAVVKELETYISMNGRGSTTFVCCNQIIKKKKLPFYFMWM